MTCSFSVFSYRSNYIIITLYLYSEFYRNIERGTMERHGNFSADQAPKKKKKHLSGEKPISKYALKQMQREAEESDEDDLGHDMTEQHSETKREHRLDHQPDYRFEACNESFTCAYCGKIIYPEGAGSEHRNHCPYCLHSLHVDNEPGDRASVCHGDMEPISVWVRDRGEWAIIHRCKKCGKLSSNRVLADDNPLELMSLAVKPLANPPFPMQFLEDFLKKK